uniref:Alpha N-terminal protein methyltransferase 1 n=1 Tax=Pinguiococcus pyrenoidosus TaxID=172671 RepID=A0A7R9YEQ0_9STRA
MGGNAPPDAVSKELVHALNSKLCAPEGESTAGDWYEDLHHLWASQLSDQEESGQPKWYSKALAYWDNEENCPPTIDGVLGGFGHVSGVDLVASRQFLSQLRLQNPQLGSQKAVECGAGIGRVVKGLLLEHFEHVELVEPSPRLLKAAEAYVAPFTQRCSFTCMGMQEYSPPERSLDLVWVQWAIGHLTDADFFSFLRRCERALRPGGVVCLKENCSASGHLVDSEDSSITRTKDYFQRVFELANMELVLEMEQEHFPDDLYPVFMFAIRPKAAIESDSRQEPVEAKEGTTGA